MKRKIHTTTNRAGGYTLVELLVVMTVIALLIGPATNGMRGVFRNGGLTQSMETPTNELGLARQASGGENREFEVRFLKMTDEDSGRSDKAFRAFQIVQRITVIDPAAAYYSRPGTDEFEAQVVPITPIRFFEEGVILLDELERSTLHAEATPKGEGKEAIPDSTETAEFSYFRFTPEGSTDLDRQKKWFATLVSESDLIKEKIDNFATFQIEPTTGKLI